MKTVLINEYFAQSFVRVGRIFRHPKNVENALSKYCRQMFVHTRLDGSPYRLLGSGTLLEFKNKLFLICTRHQLEECDLDSVSIFIPEQYVMCSASTAFVLNADDENSDSDRFDLVAFLFPDRESEIPNFRSSFFEVEEKSVWPQEDRGLFLAYGFPSKLQYLDYNISDLIRIDAKMALLSGVYCSKSSASNVHCVELKTDSAFYADGMSGGAVFYLAGPTGNYSVGFAGMIIRGGNPSNFVHFVDASSILEHLNSMIDHISATGSTKSI